jgi:hypothetical protein
MQELIKLMHLLCPTAGHDFYAIGIAVSRV